MQKHQQIIQAVSSLKKAVDSFYFFKKGGKSYHPIINRLPPKKNNTINV